MQQHTLNLGGGYSVAYSACIDDDGNEYANFVVSKNSQPLEAKEAVRVIDLFYERVKDFIDEAALQEHFNGSSDPSDPF